MAEGRQYYSPLEKALLTELVRKYKDLLENKNNDYKTIQQKNNTWETLSEQFNSQSGVKKRDAKQLKKCWENIKARAKKQLAKEKRDVKLTGGGPSTSKHDDEAAVVASIIPAQIESLSNMFDDDNCERDSDRDDEETNVQVPTTGTATPATKNELPPSSVVDAALAPSFTNKSPISAAQARCLAMQTQQHEAEMELLDLNKRNLIIAHKRKMEVLDAELQYWDMMKQSIQSTQEEVHKPNTRARKQH